MPAGGVEEALSRGAARRRLPQSSQSGDFFLAMKQQPLSACGADGLQGMCSLPPAKMAACGDLETDGSCAAAEGGDSPLQSLRVTAAPSCSCDHEEVNVNQTFPPSSRVVKVGEQYLTVRGQQLCLTDSREDGSVFQMTNGQGTRRGQSVYLVTLAFCPRQGGPPVYLGVPPQCREGELPLDLEPFSASPFLPRGKRKCINPDARRLFFTEVLVQVTNKFHLRPLDCPRMCVCLSQGKLVALVEERGDVIADFDFPQTGDQAEPVVGRGSKKEGKKRRSGESQDSGFVTDSPTQRRRAPGLASDDSLSSSSGADSLSSRPACSPRSNSLRGGALSEGEDWSSEAGATGVQTRRGRGRRRLETCCAVS